MPVNLVPVDTKPANVQAAADGDAVSQAIRTVVMQDYADWLTWITNRIGAAAAGDFQVPLIPNALYPAAWVARWAWDTANNGLVNFNVGGVDEINIPLPAMKGTTFSAVTLTVDGDANGVGPHAALPVLPRITLWRQDAGAGTLVNVGNAVDSSAAVVNYEALHTIVFTPGAAQTVDEDNQYQLSIRGESGVNAIANALVIFGCHITVVPT
jgi:hypothetical protein